MKINWENVAVGLFCAFMLTVVILTFTLPPRKLTPRELEYAQTHHVCGHGNRGQSFMCPNAPGEITPTCGRIICQDK